MAKKQAGPNLAMWEKIASFYSGSPQRLLEDPRGPMGGTTGLPMSGEVYLGRQLLEGLANWEKTYKKAKRTGNKNDMQHAAVLGSNAMSVLIHEAIHNRDFSGAKEMGGQGWYLDEDSRGPLGFYGSGNEVQAAALGAELIPDMLQRFFGIPIDSKFSKMVARISKQRGEYQGAYSPERRLPPAPMGRLPQMPTLEDIFASMRNP